MSKNGYKFGYVTIGIMVGIIVAGALHLAVPEWLITTDARLVYLKSGVEPQIVYPTEEQNPQQSETLLQPQESQESKEKQPVSENQPASEEAEVVYATETEDLSYSLEGKVLELTFKKFNKSWPELTIEEETENFFFTSTEELEQWMESKISEGYDPEEIQGVAKLRNITAALTGAPEIETFFIEGNVLTIKFVSIPEKTFEFESRNYLQYNISWEGVFIVVDDEE